MTSNIEKQKLGQRGVKVFHLGDLPYSLFILLNSKANELFFSEMYKKFGTQLRFSEFLGIARQTINKYHKQTLKSRGKYYPVYLPILLFKKCMPHLDEGSLRFIESNVSEIRARIGLSIFNPRLPIIESPEVYRIIAHILADGSAGRGKTPYYANICRESREQFKSDLSVLGSMNYYERRPRNVELVFFPKVVTDILSSLFDIRFTYPNRLPKFIFSAKMECKKAFLQALFDDEGTMSSQLTIGIHNRRIMKETKTLINSLGITTGKIMIHPIKGLTDKVTLSIPKTQYKLYQERIGFHHPDKARKLEMAIQTRNRKQRTRDPILIEQEILKLLDSKPLSTLDISNELLFTRNGVEPHLLRMFNEGILVKKGYKNRILWDTA
jgi:hypothetical protein